MGLFSFGKKRKKVSRRKLIRKPPAALLKRCRKHRIKTTMKKGGRRVYRKVSLLKKLLKKKMKKMKKSKARKTRKVYRRRRMGFGLDGSIFTKPDNFGYNQKVKQIPGTLSQTISTVNAKNNLSRPEGFSFQDSQLPAYGVFREFFGEAVPTQVPPNYNFMGQPDGSYMPVGAPFQRFTTPNSFGKKLRRYNVSGSPCNKLKKRVCRSSPNCSYTRRGCRRRKGTKSGAMVYEGPALQFGKRKNRYLVPYPVCNKLNKRVCLSNPNCKYMRGRCRRRSSTNSKMYQGPSLAFGKRRRRYNVAGSACNKLKKRVCQSSPNCSYTKRGCRRRSGTKSGAMVYEGPSLQFGRSDLPEKIWLAPGQTEKGFQNCLMKNLPLCKNAIQRCNSKYNVPQKGCNAMKGECEQDMISSCQQGNTVYKVRPVEFGRRMKFGRGPSVPFPMCHDINRKPLPSVSKSTCLSQGKYWW